MKHATHWASGLRHDPTFEKLVQRCELHLHHCVACFGSFASGIVDALSTVSVRNLTDLLHSSHWSSTVIRLL